MACPKRTSKPQSTRKSIAALFERGNVKGGNVKGGKLHRLRNCCSATDCGLLCTRLVKAPGRSPVICMDAPDSPGSAPHVNLYAALADPDFKCPEGRF